MQYCAVNRNDVTTDWVHVTATSSRTKLREFERKLLVVHTGLMRKLLIPVRDYNEKYDQQHFCGKFHKKMLHPVSETFLPTHCFLKYILGTH